MSRTFRFRLLWAAALWAGCICTAPAMEWIRRDTATLHPNEVWDREMALLVSTAEVNGVVSNDIFVGARTALLRGTFQNDVWGYAAERIVFSGEARDHARLVAPLILMEGAVSNNLTAWGDTVKMEPSASAGRDVEIHAADAIAQGHIARNLRIRSQRITLGGEIGGDVELDGTDLVVQPGTRIQGCLRYRSPVTLAISPDVRVEGGVVRQSDQESEALARHLFLWIAFGLLASLAALSGATVLVAPGLLRATSRQISTNGWRSLFTGSILMGLLPLAVGALLATLVGAWLALALLCAGAFAFSLSPVAISAAIGRRLLPAPRRGETPAGSREEPGRLRLFSQTLAGLLVLALLPFIPYAGVSLLLLALMLGTGSIVQSAFQKNTAPPPPAPPAAASSREEEG